VKLAAIMLIGYALVLAGIFRPWRQPPGMLTIIGVVLWIGSAAALLAQ
jgi:hypothetical protein